MFNLIGETLKHPFTGGRWRVISTEGEYVQLTDGTTKDYVPRVQALEMYAEQQKQRADEAEKRADAAEAKWEKLKESVKQLEKDINKWYYDSEDVLQELFDIMIKIERGEK